VEGGRVSGGSKLSGGQSLFTDGPGAFVAGAFVAGAFVAGAFVAGAFVAGAFVAGAFVTGAFVAGAFVAGAFVTPGGFVAGGPVVGRDGAIVGTGGTEPMTGPEAHEVSHFLLFEIRATNQQSCTYPGA